jgi:hypothetical protein
MGVRRTLLSRARGGSAMSRPVDPHARVQAFWLALFAVAWVCVLVLTLGTTL